MRTQRGLLIAGSLVVVILIVSLLVRPTPTLRETGIENSSGEPTEQQDDSSVDAEQAGPLLTPESGASSRDAPEQAPAEEADAPQGTTHEVANPQQWADAVAAAQPGDTIKLVATINQIIEYRGNLVEPERARGAGGTAEAPITITAAEGVWIDPGNQGNQKPGLDVLYTAHVNVVGVNVRNSQFGIRVLQSHGTAEAPILLSGNTVQDIGHSGIHVGGHLETHEPSRHVRIENNTVAGTGRTTDTYGEGIYLGYGSSEWVDETSDIAVIGNDISDTTGEGVDIKPGTSRILVEGNLIHDLSPKDGGAISAHYVGSTPNPKLDEIDPVVIRRNRIWNINLNSRGGANDWAIWVGHGGITIEGNAIWGMQGDGDTLAIRLRGLQDFGPHPIRIINNVFWTRNGWSAVGSEPRGDKIESTGNRGPSGAEGIDQAWEPGSGVPAIGSGGTADAGGGPGSAFGPWDSDTAVWRTG